MFLKLLSACQLCCAKQVLFSAVFVCLCVFVSVCTKTEKLLISDWCNVVGICLMVDARSN